MDNANNDLGWDLSPLEQAFFREGDAMSDEPIAPEDFSDLDEAWYP